MDSSDLSILTKQIDKDRQRGMLIGEILLMVGLSMMLIAGCGNAGKKNGSGGSGAIEYRYAPGDDVLIRPDNRLGIVVSQYWKLDKQGHPQYEVRYPVDGANAGYRTDYFSEPELRSPKGEKAEKE